jgi:hypothetical protein
MKTKLLIFMIILFWSLPLFAQEVDTAWVRRYNEPSDSADFARSIAVDGSGNAYVTGDSYGSGTDRDYVTIKYHPDGDTAWIRRYNGPGNLRDVAYAIVVDDLGNAYVTGQSYDNVTSYDFTTVKYHSNGDTAWARRYNGPGDGSYDVAYAIAVDDWSNVYVTGFSHSTGTWRDYATIKYYPNGDTAWARTYNGPVNEYDEARAIAVDDLGNVYVTGGSYGSGTNSDFTTIKYYPDGDTAWVRRYNGPTDSTDYARDVVLDGSGNVYVTGLSYGNGTDRDFATVKYDQSGNELWVRRYNGPVDSTDAARAMALDGSGDIYVTGSSYGSGTSFDWTTIKYYPNGDTAWVRRYNGFADSMDVAIAIAVDGLDNVYVTGYSWNNGTERDYTTIKYYPNGDTAWITRYNGDADSTDTAGDIAVDDLGNVYVTGSSYGIGTDQDYATIKYVQHEERVEICSAFLSPKRLNVAGGAGNSFWIHLRPCESMEVAKGDSAEVYVDVDGSDTFDDDELYPAVVISPGILVKVYCPDLVDNDPKVAIYGIDDIPVSDASGNDVILYLDTFTPPGKGPKVSVSPDQFSLGQNYPNPFNPTCEISYTLPTDCHITLTIYNMLGQKVRVLVNEYQNAGYRSVKWDGRDDRGQEVTSGIYFYRLHTEDLTKEKKMLLLR